MVEAFKESGVRRTPIVVVLALLVTGCNFDLPAPPPRLTRPAPSPYVRSTVAMPISVDLTDVRDRVFEELKARPLVEGRTPELGARLLAQEKSIFDEPQKIVDVPYRAARCSVESIPENITEQVKVGVETFSCLIQPWKWGKCSRDVFKNVTKTIWKDVTKCVPEQIEVARTVYTAVERLTPKVFETTAFINYRVDVSSVHLEVQGQRLKVSIGVNAPVSADITQNLLVGNITAKGALACSSNISVGADATFSLVQRNGDVGIDVDVGNVDLDIKKFCIPGAVELVDAWGFTGVQEFAMTQVVRLAVNKALAEATQKAIATEASKLALGSMVGQAVTDMHGTHSLGSGVFLTTLPAEVRLSQIEGALEGGRQVLRTSAAVDLDIEVSYGAGRPLPPANKIPVSLGTPPANFSLMPRGVIPFDMMSSVLLQEAHRAADEQLMKAGYELGDVEVYQSGESIVFGVQVKSRSWWRPSARLYLSGRPKYLATTGQLALSDLDFTADTSNWLAKRSLGAVRPLAISVIAPKMVFSVDEQLAKATKEFAVFKLPIKSKGVVGFLSGTTVPPKLHAVWLDTNSLQFDLEIIGEAKLDLVLQ